jgi:PHD/YefM family antitoxin component YafN of YafNO toxin-antitoxin module
MKGADSMKIIPMRDLKNTVEIERLCAEENGPVFVTKNGYGRLVVMDIDYYEKTMRKMCEAQTILDGLEDIKSGNTVDGDTAISNIKIKSGIPSSIPARDEMTTAQFDQIMATGLQQAKADDSLDVDDVFDELK